MRRKRQSQANSVVTKKINDGENVVFYIGFKLDGHQAYENTTQELPQYDKIDVYINPTFEHLSEGTLLFRPYWPHNDKQIEVKVCIQHFQNHCKYILYVQHNLTAMNNTIFFLCK